MIGVALIHITPKEISMGQNQTRDEISSLTLTADSLQDVTGLAAVFCACLISGFVGVFFEKLLKESAQQSVVIRYDIILTHYQLMQQQNYRNLQLGLFSIVLSFLSLFYSLTDISEKGIFYGYSYSTLILLALQSGQNLSM